MNDDFIAELEAFCPGRNAVQPDASLAASMRQRRLNGNPFDSLSLHRLMAYGRDHGSQMSDLAKAVGEQLVGDMLTDGLPEEQQLQAIQTIGERVLTDRRLLGLDPWPEFDRTLEDPPVIGCLSDLYASLGRELAAGLPLAKRVEWFSCGPDGATKSGVSMDRDRANDEVARRVVNAYQRLEGKVRGLWSMPQNTPLYLLPREEMGTGHALADPILRELVERGWDAMVMVHLTAKANSHPASTENHLDRAHDAAIDSTRLEAVRVKIGERVLETGGAPTSCRSESKRSLLPQSAAH